MTKKINFSLPGIFLVFQIAAIVVAVIGSVQSKVGLHVGGLCAFIVFGLFIHLFEKTNSTVASAGLMALVGAALMVYPFLYEVGPIILVVFLIGLGGVLIIGGCAFLGYALESLMVKNNEK